MNEKSLRPSLSMHMLFHFSSTVVLFLFVEINALLITIMVGSSVCLSQISSVLKQYYRRMPTLKLFG